MTFPADIEHMVAMHEGRIVALEEVNRLWICKNAAIGKQNYEQAHVQESAVGVADDVLDGIIENYDLSFAARARLATEIIKAIKAGAVPGIVTLKSMVKERSEYLESHTKDLMAISDVANANRQIRDELAKVRAERDRLRNFHACFESIYDVHTSDGLGYSGGFICCQRETRDKWLAAKV
jgi:hypothetical protein